jgi:uncharacterized protein DUF6491
MSRIIFLTLAVLFMTTGVNHAQETNVREGTMQEGTMQDADPSRTVEDILTRDPEAADYGDRVDCIATRRIRSIDVLDDKHVAIKMSRGEYYLVQFQYRCPGLRRNNPVVYEPRGSNRFCVHDAIRATYRGAIGELTPGMRCGVPGFQSITKEQLLVLKDTLRVERRKAREPKAPDDSNAEQAPTEAQEVREQES